MDLIYYGNQRQLEYDFIIAPGNDPKVIKLAFEGADNIRTDPQGDLVLQTAIGELRMHRPLVYQIVGGIKQEIAGSYVLNPKSKITNPKSQLVGFQVADYDRSRHLIIDPVLSYSSYVGGSGFDSSLGIAVDGSGNVYLTGETESTNFPIPNPLAFQAFFHPSGFLPRDAFVVKLNSAGTGFVYSTYLGGNDFDRGTGIAVDGEGNAYVTGQTFSNDFPTTPGVLQQTHGGSTDAFVVKLDSTGAPVYSTFLGGAGGDVGMGIAVDSSGNAYVTGQNQGGGFPTVNAFQDVNGGGAALTDAFVAKLNDTGTALVYSTYLGGSGDENRFEGMGSNPSGGIAVDPLGNAYVTGMTEGSTNFPTANAAQPVYAGGEADAFVTKLNATGALVYSTFLGGSGFDAGFAIAADSAGTAYVTGETRSDDFPTFSTATPLQPTLQGSQNAFVTKLDPLGAFIYSTFLGGSDLDSGFGIAAGSAGNAYVTGGAGSFDFPVVRCVQGTNKGRPDGFVTTLNPQGSAIISSTYLGGSAFDTGSAIAVDALGNAFISGQTSSTDFPIFNALQAALAGGGRDAFFAKIDLAGTPGNDPPFFDQIPNRTVAEDSGPQSLTLSCVTPGPADEAGQSVSFVATSSNTTIVPDPTITGTGETRTLTFQPAPNANGTVIITVSADDGQPQNNIFTGTFAITVTPVNDPPFFDPIADQTVSAGAPPQSVTITGIVPGPANEANQTVTLTATSDNPGVVPDPSVSAVVAGSVTLTYQPAASTSGKAIITVTANDGRARNNTFSRKFTTTVSTEVLNIGIDIKPGSFPNTINLGSGGTVPVAIFSTTEFDATTVDPTTVTLASAPVALKGKGTPMAAAQDVNGDRLMDLVVHVSTEALQLSDTDTEAVLEGQTFSGTRIRGTDSVRVVP